MEERLRTLAQHPGLTITIRSGTEHFRGGQITLSLRGDGDATIEQLRSGEHTRFAAKLGAARVDQVGRALGEHGFTRSRRSSLPREPGDTPLILDLSQEGQVLFHADLWYGDRYQDADLSAILDLWSTLLHEISGGKLGHA